MAATQEGSVPTGQRRDQSSLVQQRVEVLLRFLNGLASGELDYAHFEDHCSAVLRVATREVIRHNAVVPYLPRGLAAEKNPGVTRLVLKVIHVHACSDDLQDFEFIQSTQLWPLIIQRVSYDDLGVHQLANDILVHHGRIHPKETLELLSNSAEFAALISSALAAKASSTLRLRLCSFLCALGGTSEQLFEFLRDTLQQVLGQWKASRNLDHQAFICLSLLLGSRASLLFLHEQGIIGAVQSLIAERDVLMLGPAIEFLSELAVAEAKLSLSQEESAFERYPFVELLGAMLPDDPELFDWIRTAALAALEAVASASPLHLRLVYAHESTLQAFFALWSHSSVDLRICCIRRTAQLFEAAALSDALATELTQSFLPMLARALANPEVDALDCESTLDDYVEVLSGRLFDMLENNRMQDYRVACFHMMSALVEHGWAVRTLIVFPGFVEFITNPRTEESLVGREWKYAIIQRLLVVHQDYLTSTLEEAEVHNLNVFLKKYNASGGGSRETTVLVADQSRQ
eukprot:CAMPEP_0177653336 /NCGR_PEP_ID=MMETSP0447-20121125/13679_1 /TAXON_ID=0 /ORGANISM="Stygamoeba regulata, Strain BSH-02190019" /LENGTH=517 /DNA_ID=CAMNT_0019156781 /DNA_START=51 /DNA_END=1604 /DNA_ORIENTATION=-